LGNKTALNDWSGRTAWIYDSLNRVINVNRGNPDTAYGYDAAGNLAWIRAENQKPVSYSYDAANRLSTVTDWAGRVTSYSYDAAGRFTGCAYPNGVTASLVYDQANRLTSIQYSRGGTNLSSVAYTLDAVGNRTSQTDLLGQRTNYYYDNLNRLYFVSYPGSQANLYGYDAAGNRTAMTPYQNGQPELTFRSYYDAANQPTFDEHGNSTYDLNGNLIQAGPSRSLLWNAQQRLSALYDSDRSEFFSYDGDGRRIQQTINGVTKSFIVDTRSPVSRVLLEYSSSSSTTYYVYGRELLYTVDGVTPHYLHSDGLGSVIAGTDGSGAKEITLNYDAFGFLTGGSWSSWWPTRQYTGEETDSIYGSMYASIVYLRARYYDPLTGRFISRDPVPPDLDETQNNCYLYVHNNPMTHTDPSGEYGFIDDALLFGIGAVNGVIGQGIGDVISGNRSPVSHYVASALGGGVGLWSAEYLGPGGGFVGGAVSNVIRQSADMRAGRRQAGSFSDFAFETASSGLTATKNFRVAGVSAGSNSYISIYNQVVTKFRNGSITNVSSRTAAKMLTGYTTSQLRSTMIQSSLSSVWGYFTMPPRAW
jgi:RHS repeat-associated protein